MDDASKPKVLFVADSHFHLRPDAAERERLSHFLDLLRLAQRADALVLLGDIFDFWFDYPHFRLKGYEEILNVLDEVKNAGTTIHFVGGNHDIWAASYFRDRFGVTGDGLPLTLDAGGLRVRLVHGDGIIGKDLLYSSFRATVRNKVGIFLAKSLHPEILFALSTWLSGKSRSATRDEATTMIEKARAWLSKQQDPDWDLLVLGHVHHPFQLEHQGRTMAALGGWLGREGYGLLRDGRFELRDFAADPPPVF